MKYKLCKNCKAIQNENEMLLINEEQNSEISLNINLEEFEQILNGSKLKSILNKIKLDINHNFDELKNFNSLIYALLEQKIIEPFSVYSFKEHTIWLKSCLIELTDYCNFRCPHCYVDKTQYNKLSLDNIKNIADELLHLNCNKITLTGGEVLTHNEFISIYTYLYSKGFIIGINSNGSLFNDKIIETLSLMPPYAIEISLYGCDTKTYQDFTKTDSFNAVIDNVLKLKSKNIKLVLKNIITNSNKNHFNKIRKLANDLDIEFRSDYISFPQINGKFCQNPEQISVADTIESLKIQPTAHEYFINLYNSYQKEDNLLFKCKKMDDSIFINSKLDVCMCICMQSYTFKYIKGNLLDCIIKLQDFRKIKLNPDNKCLNCRLLPICRYCPAKFYLTTGDYQHAPEWFCEYSNQVYETFIKGYHFLRKRYLSDKILDIIFRIIKNNMIKIGFNICDKDKDFWISNLKQELLCDNFYLYLIYNNGEVCGFVEALEKDNQLIISEIQFDDNVKGSKLILHTINFILNNKLFYKFDKAYFSINKNNAISHKTFTHLGAKIILEKEKSFKYEILKSEVEKYIKYLTKE